MSEGVPPVPVRNPTDSPGRSHPGQEGLGPRSRMVSGLILGAAIGIVLLLVFQAALPRIDTALGKGPSGVNAIGGNWTSPLDYSNLLVECEDCGLDHIAPGSVVTIHLQVINRFSSCAHGFGYFACSAVYVGSIWVNAPYQLISPPEQNLPLNGSPICDGGEHTFTVLVRAPSVEGGFPLGGTVYYSGGIQETFNPLNCVLH
jgi:hypothetical protein